MVYRVLVKLNSIWSNKLGEIWYNLYIVAHATNKYKKQTNAIS